MIITFHVVIAMLRVRDKDKQREKERGGRESSTCRQWLSDLVWRFGDHCQRFLFLFLHRVSHARQQCYHNLVHLPSPSGLL